MWRVQGAQRAEGVLLIWLVIFGSPFAAARAGRKCLKGRAHDAREFVARTGTCVQRTPACPRALPKAARHPGCISLGYFSLCKQREVTRALDARGKANGHGRERIESWIPACAGMTSKGKDTGLQTASAARPSPIRRANTRQGIPPAQSNSRWKDEERVSQTGRIALSAARAASNEKCARTLARPFADSVFHSVSSA